jgi:hypothetical protein
MTLNWLVLVRQASTQGSESRTVRTINCSSSREFRVKDLHDIARILRARPMSDATFWNDAGQEFLLAC